MRAAGPSSGGGDGEPLRSEGHGAPSITDGEIRPGWMLSAADTDGGSVAESATAPLSGGGDGEPLRSEGYGGRRIISGEIRPEWMLSAADTKERVGKGVGE